jgi:hypothetical protein
VDTGEVWQVVDVLMGVDEAVLHLSVFFAPSPILGMARLENTSLSVLNLSLVMNGIILGK